MPAADGSSPRRPLPRVLVVDDDDAIRSMLTEALEFEGYEVECARDGQEALGYIREALPQAIVLDLLMPVMDGWTFLQRCSDEALCPSVPIVVVSASYNLRNAAAELSSRGVSMVIAKPYSVDLLVGAVDRVVGRSGA